MKHLTITRAIVFVLIRCFFISTLTSDCLFFIGRIPLAPIALLELGNIIQNSGFQLFICKASFGFISKGGFCVFINPYYKSLNFKKIDCELDIIKMELEHPERLTAGAAPVPLTKWTGTMADLLEIIIALFLTGLIRKPSGHKMNLAEVAELFGKLFGVEPRDLYGRKSKLMIRKKNEAPFLDSLVFLYRKEANK